MATATEVKTEKKVKPSGFNYSLTEMKKALSSPKTKVPRIKNIDDLDNWLRA